MSKNCTQDPFDEERAVYLNANGRGGTARTVEIGKKLHELGGINAMLLAAEEVKKLGNGDHPELNYAWDKIGNWKA